MRGRMRAVVAALVVTALAGPALAAEPASLRLAGADRYETARAATLATFGRSAVAVLASGERHADALVGTYLAGLVAGPLLLTAAGELPTSTRSTLADLGVTTVVIVSTGSAVSPLVDEQLAGLGVASVRISGATAVQTARLVAERAGAGAVGTTSVGGAPARTAIVANSDAFADALAAGPLSYAAHLPLLLTGARSLASDVTDAIEALGVRTVVVLGGTGAVGPAAEAALRRLGVQVVRVAGADRTETATRLADLARTRLGFGTVHADLARGDAFADALAAGVHAGRERAPLLLVRSRDDLGPATTGWLATAGGALTGIHVFGGAGGVAGAAESAALAAARRAPAGAAIDPEPSGAAPLVACAAPTSGPGRPFCARPIRLDALTFSDVSLSGGIVTAVYNRRLDCTSVHVDDFTLAFPDATGHMPTIDKVNCTQSGVQVLLRIRVPFVPKTGELAVRQGSDGNTVRSADGLAQAAGDRLSFDARGLTQTTTPKR